MSGLLSWLEHSRGPFTSATPSTPSDSEKWWNSDGDHAERVAGELIEQIVTMTRRLNREPRVYNLWSDVGLNPQSVMQPVFAFSEFECEPTGHSCGDVTYGDGLLYDASLDWMNNPSLPQTRGLLRTHNYAEMMDSILSWVPQFSWHEEVKTETGTWWPLCEVWSELPRECMTIAGELIWTHLHDGGATNTLNLFRVVGHLDDQPIVTPYDTTMFSLGLFHAEGEGPHISDGWPFNSRDEPPSFRHREWVEHLDAESDSSIPDEFTFAPGDQPPEVQRSAQFVPGLLSSTAALVILRGCEEEAFPIGSLVTVQDGRFILGDDGVFDLMRIANRTKVQRFDEPLAFGDETCLEVGWQFDSENEIWDTDSRISYRFANELDMLSYVVGRTRFNQVFGMSVAGENSVEADESSDAFVPTWKDRRLPAFIDRSTRGHYHFHDLIRCHKCNGRVIIMLPSGNALTAHPCPHCAAEEGLDTSHLTGSVTDRTIRRRHQ